MKPCIMCSKPATVTAGYCVDHWPSIPMRLTCPSCAALHIDEGEFATKPHHTHACQACGMVWRPAIVATVGVRFLPNFKNEPGIQMGMGDAYGCFDHTADDELEQGALSPRASELHQVFIAALKAEGVRSSSLGRIGPKTRAAWEAVARFPATKRREGAT